MARRAKTKRTEDRRAVKRPGISKFKEIEKRLRKELRATPSDEFGTLADWATVGGGGEPLGTTFAEPERRSRRVGKARRR